MVILTARDEKRGTEAVENLKACGLSDSDIFFHQLDVIDSASIVSLAYYIKNKFGKLDIFVNNAGVSGVIMDAESFTSLKLKFGEEDFFVVLHNMLTSISKVSEVHCVKDAKVPLMRFKLHGISIDLHMLNLNSYNCFCIHTRISCYDLQNVDILNPFFLSNIDETSWRSLSGVHANKCILRLLPNMEVFKSLLRCVKLWAKRRGVYGNLLVFFGGVHLAILAAFICQRHANVSLNGLISNFFKTFAFWDWQTPVILQDGMVLVTISASEIRSLMPIRLPCRPHDHCHSNITKSTFYRIRTEFHTEGML
ncbi:hypothetical protein ACSBR1_038668 [Camellia fascicularis]